MPINVDRALHLLRTFDLRSLFIGELGWDRHAATFDAIVEGQRLTLGTVAQKRGLVVYTCTPGADGRMPPAPQRRAIEQRVAEVVREHIIIFHDASHSESIWQWVRRSYGQPSVPREEAYHHVQSGQRLVQRLRALAFTLDEEADLTLTDVRSRVGSTFVEQVTKRFYERYQAEHSAFVPALHGLPDLATQRWYTSVLFNRLMCTYFIQKKGLLDGDPNYLNTRFERSKRRGRDRFYREFLQPLFFDGLARPSGLRSPDHLQLLGAVPYLNGGLFQLHHIERQYGERIAIADAAFERPLAFLDDYRWHLDDRPLHKDGEINPEVLGYIFERYINQKQMGAYYTQEDITGYIARSSIIPALFDSAQTDCPHAFVPDGPIWRQLQAAPERYLFNNMRHGEALALPPAIAAGQSDVAQRATWNAPAAEGYALPTETWREVVARRQRAEALRQQLAAGAFTTINDLVTSNLDLASFAQDVIATTDDPDLLLALWRSIEQITIVDPTCGSGAFLFAALHVLQPLYELCLDRMAVLVREHASAQPKGAAPALATFRTVLARVAQHPNRPYFVLKSIIVNNLYGVDLMEEAVEVCKLRLFLTLAAHLERDDTLPNMGAEPLPDIDFNIFAGNALVGYASYPEVQRALSQTTSGQGRLPLDPTGEQIAQRVQHIDAQCTRFRRAQIDTAQDAQRPEKLALQHSLDDLADDLNRSLASEYGVDATDAQRLAAWRATHAPFHWFVTFYHAIHQRGGFDVVIGNPPYVGYPKIKSVYTVRGYATERCANLYAFTVERSLALLRPSGRYGMIVPIASVSTEGMRALQDLYTGYRQWHSQWAVRPGKLFVGVDMNLTISLLHKEHAPTQSYTTGYRRWSSGADGGRDQLFTTLAYTRNPQLPGHANPYPKLGSALESQILARMHCHKRLLRHYTDPTGCALYYHSGGRYWRKTLPTKLSSHYKPVQVRQRLIPIVFALLNSQLFYWYWIANSNCMDVVSREVLDLPVFALDTVDSRPFSDLMEHLLAAYYAHTTRTRRGDCISRDEINFDVQHAKPIIDRIDTLLAAHYGFTAEERDCILNYDIKYRMRRETEGET